MKIAGQSGKEKGAMRYGGEIPPRIRDIVCGHIADYGRREKLLARASKLSRVDLRLRQYNRGVDRAFEQALNAHGIHGAAAEVLRRDVLALASGRLARSVNSPDATMSRGLYIAIREDVFFFTAREFGLI